MSDETKAVLAANAAFYQAFAGRDVEAMGRLWADREQSVCIHPGWDALHGYALIMASWHDILANPGSPDVRATDARASVHGELGIVTCHEILPDGVLVATNLFVRQDGDWRMMHHQAGPTALDVPRASAAPSDLVH